VIYERYSYVINLPLFEPGVFPQPIWGIPEGRGGSDLLSWGQKSKQASKLSSFLSSFPPFHASRFLDYSGRPGFWVLAVRDIHAHWAAVYCMYVCMYECVLQAETSWCRN